MPELALTAQPRLFISEYGVYRSALSSSDMAAYNRILRNIYYIVCELLIFRTPISEKAQEVLTSPAVAKDQQMSAEPHRITTLHHVRFRHCSTGLLRDVSIGSP
jgi:hypothetical protein